MAAYENGNMICKRCYDRHWRIANPDYFKVWNLEHPDYAKISYLENREQRLNYNKVYRLEHMRYV
jgi:hypothetical protein